MLEFVPAPPKPAAADWWCADCATTCFVNDESRCTGCAGELTVMLPSAELPVSRVRVVAEHQLAQGVELEDPAGALLPLISTPEDLARWLAVVAARHQAELEAAAFLDLKSELQDVAQHLLTELRRRSQDVDRLQSSIRAAAASAGLPLAIVSGSGRVLTLSTSELVMALGEAAARGRESPAPAPLVGSLTLTHGLEALAAYEAGAPARPADPTAEVLAEVQAERARQVARWGRQHHRRDMTNFSLLLTSGQREPQPDVELASRAGELRALVQAQAVSPWGSAWSCILLEEVAEAFEASQAMLTGAHPSGISDRAQLRTELVQVAAVATAWIEALDQAPDAAPESDTGRLVASERERDRLEREVDGHQAAARRAVGLLQRTAAALRALDADVQASSWRGAEQHLGAPLSDQTLRGLADHLEGELRRPVRG